MMDFSQFSFARQFLLLSFLILTAGMLIIGAWVGQQIETGVTNRTAVMTALYVDSFIAQYLQDLAHSERLSAEQLDLLDSLFAGTALSQRIVAFKVWRLDGTILYSTNPALIDRNFPVTPPLARAFNGDVYTEISDLSDAENEHERQRWSRLLETYAPVREKGTDTVIAVMEFYQTTEDLDREVSSAQLNSWMVVGIATLAMYLLLVGLVRRANNTIIAQQTDLRDNVEQLTALLAQNEQLHARLRRAAVRTTALNERFLHRIAADLHDGSAQDLSLALLRIDALDEAYTGCAEAMGKGQTVSHDLHTVRTALQSALADLRAIASGLRLPTLETLSTAEVAKRAVSDYERKTEKKVKLSLGDLPKDSPFPVKITLYRLLQESLANGYRHADGIGQRVSVNADGRRLIVEVADAGPGFDAQTAPVAGHLGLAGMRERVEILAGTFEVNSMIGAGTVIRACLPLTIAEVEDG